MKLLFACILGIFWALKFAVSQAAFNAVKWNKRSGDFEPIFGSSSYEHENREIGIQGGQQENFNFNRQPLTISYMEDFGFFHFQNNDTTATGVYGDVYTILSEFLNFTLVLSNSGDKVAEGRFLPNGSYDGLLEDARLNQTDIIPKLRVYVTRINAVTFTQPFQMNGQRIYMHEKWKRNYTWMFSIFPIKIWVDIGFAVFTLSIVSLVIERVSIRHRGRQLRSRSYADHLFDVSSVFFNQVNAIDTISKRCKILAFTIGCFCWLILTFYNAHLINFMTAATTSAPFGDLEELFKNTNLHVVVVQGSFAHAVFYGLDNTYPAFANLRKAKRFTVLSHIEELFHQVCSKPNKYVLFGSEDAMEARKNKPCNLIPIGKIYSTLPVASGLSKRVKNTRSFDIGILKLLEFGIMDAIKNRYLTSTKKKTSHHRMENLAIDMDGTFVIFGILCFGVIASIVICVAENVLTTLKKRKTKNKVQSFTRRLPTVTQYPFGRNIHS